MSIRKISFAEGEYYHVFNRGNAKRTIFEKSEDYIRFLQLLLVCNTSKAINLRDIPKEFVPDDPLVAIGAYCLMPNHFHILIKEIKNGGLTKFMQKVSTSYAMYFNKKYGMSGGLFEGKFKAEHLSSDNYLKYIYAYIHMNPIKLIEPNWRKIGLKNKIKCYEYVNSYPYSSYSTYLEDTKVLEKQSKILTRGQFPKYFSSVSDHKKEITSWISPSSSPRPCLGEDGVNLKPK